MSRVPAGETRNAFAADCETGSNTRSEAAAGRELASPTAFTAEFLSKLHDHEAALGAELCGPWKVVELPVGLHARDPDPRVGGPERWAVLRVWKEGEELVVGHVPVWDEAVVARQRAPPVQEPGPRSHPGGVPAPHPTPTTRPGWRNQSSKRGGWGSRSASCSARR